MTETTQTKSKSLGFIIPVVLVVLLISAVGYYVTVSGIDKKAVTNALDQWAADASKRAEGKLNAFSFTYDDVEMAGGATNRHAIVLNPVISFTDKQTQSEQIKLSTSRMELHARSVRMNKVRIVFAEPIQVQSGEQEPMVLTMEEPMLIEAEKVQQEDDYQLVSQLKLPSAMAFATAAQNDTIRITMADGALISGSMLQSDPRAGESGIMIKDLAVVSDKTQETMKVEEVSASFTSKAMGEGRYEVGSILNVINAAAEKTTMPFGALSLRVHANYSGPWPESGAAPEAMLKQPMELSIKKLELAGTDASVGLVADLTLDPKDYMPAMDAQFKVQNFAAVRAFLNENMRFSDEDMKLVNAILVAVTGQNYEQADHLDVAIKRETGGQMHIGKTTLEPLMAIVLSGGELVPHPSAPEDGVPAEDAPADAPEMPAAPVEELAPEAVQPELVP